MAAQSGYLEGPANHFRQRLPLFLLSVGRGAGTGSSVRRCLTAFRSSLARISLSPDLVLNIYADIFRRA